MTDSVYFSVGPKYQTEFERAKRPAVLVGEYSSIARRTLYNINTTLAENRIYVNLVYSIDISKCNYIEAKNKITGAFIAANVTNAIEGSILRDLCNTRDGCSYIEYFIRDDVNTLIEDICMY